VSCTKGSAIVATVSRQLRSGSFLRVVAPLILQQAIAQIPETYWKSLGRSLTDQPIGPLLLVDRHTASAAEMIVAFARENKLATIVGEKTAGRLLSATSVKVGNGFG
jgi:C-terminal processing protease CtpA/Prc